MPQTRNVSYQPGIYLLRVNNRNIEQVWNMFKVNDKYTRTTPLALKDNSNSNSIDSISHLVLVFLLLILSSNCPMSGEVNVLSQQYSYWKK